ncbi:MAG TPA: PPC domain-containing protein, partial [Gemmata sp.]|nr:PPC domain-containing protein [Gemmata sp.]
MLTHRVSAIAVLLTVSGFAAAQNGPQLLTVFPPGAKAGETVEVACSGIGFEGEEKLLFSATGFKAERIGSVKVDPKEAKDKKGRKGQPATTAVKFKVTAPEQIGTYDVRVVGKNGLSNPRAFLVGKLTETNEVEPNNDVSQAQKIDLETTVNGVINSPVDVDFVSFKAKAGQNVVVYCLTTSIDSKLSADIMVATPDGKRLAENRGYRDGDAVLDFKAPTDGEYLVRVSQFAYTTGGSDHFYRLTVTAGEWIDAFWPPLASKDEYMWTTFGRNIRGGAKAEGLLRQDGRPYERNDRGPALRSLADIPPDELQTGRRLPPSAAMIDGTDIVSRDYSGNLRLRSIGNVERDNLRNSTPDTAQAVKLPCDIAGRIAKKNDRHWYSFDAKKGEVWTLEVFADRIGSPIDAYFILTDEKGKVIVEADEGPPPLSPNQFYTKSDDPARYRFVAPAEGKYRVMVSARDAAIQYGVREQYVLRIAKEKPEFRLAIMPFSQHLPDAGTLPRGGAVLYYVFVFRMDGFNDAIELSATNLPRGGGVTCPRQVIGEGQTRGTFVLLADKDAKDWEGFIEVKGFGGKSGHTARPFTITWPAVGANANQVPNTPMITRMDRGDGLALAIRGEAPFVLTPSAKELK